MTEYEFITDQMESYGEDYILSLLDDGFVPVYIAGRGWRWIAPVKQLTRQVH